MAVPAFRPDLNAINGDFRERMDYFHENGCRLSDHAVDEMNDEILKKIASDISYYNAKEYFGLKE